MNEENEQKPLFEVFDEECNEIKIYQTDGIYDTVNTRTPGDAPIVDLERCFHDINILGEAVHANAVEKGFWDKPNNVAEKLMLIVSELGEACEADRKNKHTLPDMLNSSFLNENETFEECVKDTFEDELADVAIRLFDLAAGMKIDLGKHIKLKMDYNRQRERLHGKRY